MGDSTLRDLERRWQETGTVADEAAYLEARVRAGDLAPDRLELAAQVGYPAAAVLRPEVEADVREVSIRNESSEVLARIAFAVAWAEAPRDLLEDTGSARALRRTFDLCAAAIADPSEATRARLESNRAMAPRLNGLVDLLLRGELAPVLTTDPLVLREVARDVGRWVLGLGDPVAERLDPLDELRERWGEFAAPDADLLSLRVRAGDLAEGALAVLVVLRYPEAVELIGESEGTLRELAAFVKPLGRTRLLQLALAAAELSRPGWEARHPGDSAYAEGVEALRAWCEDGSPANAKRVNQVLEAAEEHDEPPWALVRAGLIVRARDLEAAARAAHGALSWTHAERIVGEFDYTLARKVSGDRLDRLAPEDRERLGLANSESIFDAPAATALLTDLAPALIPLCLRSSSPRVGRIDAGGDVAVVPVPRRWEEFVALDVEASTARLVERVRAKDLELEALRTAGMLGHAPSQAAVDQLGEAPRDSPADPQAWCDAIWTCGAEPWGFAVLAYLAQEAEDLAEYGFQDWPALVRAWLDGDASAWSTLKGSARWHLNGAGLRNGQPIDECNYAPAHPDDARALAVLSLSRRRGFRYQRAAKAIGAPGRRAGVAREVIPSVLGYTRFPDSACPLGTVIEAYDPGVTFGEGAWIHHANFGLGQVVRCEAKAIGVQFDGVGRRKLRHGGRG